MASSLSRAARSLGSSGAAYDEGTNAMQCSFCLRGSGEVAHLVHGTNGAICDVCAQRIVRALGPSGLERRRDEAHQLALLPPRSDEVANAFGSERACRVALVVAAFAQYFDHWVEAGSTVERERAASHFWQLIQTDFAWSVTEHLQVAAALETLVDRDCRTHAGA